MNRDVDKLLIFSSTYYFESLYYLYFMPADIFWDIWCHYFTGVISLLCSGAMKHPPAGYKDAILLSHFFPQSPINSVLVDHVLLQHSIKSRF